MKLKQFWSQLVIGVISTGIYFLFGKLGLLLATVQESASPVWPATGLALALLLILGLRFWPSVFLGAFFVNLSTTWSIDSSLGIALGNTLEAVAATWLVNRYANGGQAFFRVKDFFKFVFLILGSTTISASIGVSSLLWGGHTGWANYPIVWLTWWLGDSIGALTVAPLLILWKASPRVNWPSKRKMEVFLIFFLALAFSLSVFSELFPDAYNYYPLTFFCFPLLIWTAFRFGARAAVTLNFLVSSIAILGTVYGSGPFVKPYYTENESLLLLQILMVLYGITALMISALVEERKRIETYLRRAEETLEERIKNRTKDLRDSEKRFQLLVDEINDYAILMLDAQGKVTSWNKGAEQIQGYKAEEIIGQHFSLFYPVEDRMKGQPEFNLNVAAQNGGVQMEGWRMRKDGSQFLADVVITALKAHDGTLRGYAKITRDVTERKRLEEERQTTQILKNQVDELSRRTLEMSILNDMTEMLRAAMSVSEAYPIIPQFLQELFPGQSGRLYMFNNSRNLLESVGHWGSAPPREEVLVSNECWALRRGKEFFVDDPSEGVICKHLKLPVEGDSLCMPIMAQGEILGLFHFLGSKAKIVGDSEVVYYATYRQRLARLVSEQIASALVNVRLKESLRQQASRDSLTGLFNRRYLEESLEREIHRAKRRSTRIGVVMMDLDRFKKFNDKFGHQAGDSVLQQISTFFRSKCRGEDIVCRYGGEEFTMVFADCDLKDVLAKAKEINRHVKSRALEYEGRTLGKISLSIGIALFPDHGQHPEQLLEAADKALYQAKKAGGDRVLVAPSMRVITK